MSTAKGLLLVTMEPALNDDAEFNAWYDSEHVPERAAVPGFESALRYVCLAGWPRYLAVYDLAALDVLRSDAYRAIGGENLSVWSKRMTRDVRGYYRLQGEQIHPGEAVTLEDNGRRHLTVMRFRGADEAVLLTALREHLEARRQVAQLRLYRNEVVEGEHVALIEHRAPVNGFEPPAALLDAATGALDLVNTYSPYWRR
jgi:hypothetical protein